MHKYTFWIYHKEYHSFLEDMQELGVLHINDKKKINNEESENKLRAINRVEQTIRFLNKRKIKQSRENKNLDGAKIVEDIAFKQKQLIILEQELVEENKKQKILEPWGNFSNKTIEKLKQEGYHIRFFTVSKKKFSNDIIKKYDVEVISETKDLVYFITIQKGKAPIGFEAEEIVLPKSSLTEIRDKINTIKNNIVLINSDFGIYAKAAIPAVLRYKNQLTAELDYEKVVLNTGSHAENKVRILQGWVPQTNKKSIDRFLEANTIFHVIEQGSAKDNIPVLIKNNRFSKLFEPIGKLFSLPAYSELDLTLFFAPFFMLFFGFCLGDAGYGLLFLIGAAIYKLKAKKELKPILSLLQWLGFATIIFGIITGTFFGVNLIETEIRFLSEYKQLFLDPDKMFNLALLLGAFQIIFAMFLKATNQIKQNGFAHSLPTFGWLITILGGAAYFLLTKPEKIPANQSILYSIFAVGGILIIFFSDVNINVFARIGKGVWDIYSTVTGVFGDILSYIRLFALGLSSAILGFVINDIGLQILSTSKIIGPIFFIIFLVFGHTLNILIASLGSFVHPMRLTFVEFYKNAGFKGGGKEYKPFKKI